MSLGNGNPKHGDKGSNFDFEHRVLKGMTAIAEAMENTPHNYGLFSQTTSSTPVAATTTEGSLIGTGVGQLSVPADGFVVGDSFSVIMGGSISTGSGQTIRIRVKADNGVTTINLADSGVQTLTNNLSNEAFELRVNFTIRSIGAATVASIKSMSTFVTNRNLFNILSGFEFSNIESTNFDTTLINTLDITAEWGSNNAANSISSDIFTLIKIF